MTGECAAPNLPRLGRSERIVVAVLFVATSILLLANLGNQYLWQDEAQTALLARTVLSAGVPLGHDGVNSFSQEHGIEFDENRLWKWHTWLSFYLCAASLALFGSNAWAARLPFALFGIATVMLTYFAGRSFWDDRRAAAASAGLLALSVPFLILCRQSRYYSVAAFFTLLALVAYVRLRRGQRYSAALLFAAATLLFHTHYIYCGTLLATLILHALWFHRPHVTSVVRVSVFVALINLPWMLWFSTIRYGENYASRMLDLGLTLEIAVWFVRMLVDFTFHPVFVLSVLGVGAVRWRGGRPIFGSRPETRSYIALVGLLCAVNIAVLSATAPSGYFRYLAPLIAPLFLLAGLLIALLLKRSRWLAGAVMALWLALGSIHKFAYELTHDFDGPIEGIVETLRQYADPGDLVAINYGDLPIKFYTGMRVVGGLTGEDLASVDDADWIILRRNNVGAEEDRRIRRRMNRQIATGRYSLRVIDYPDTAFENREDPALHRFRTGRDVAGVRIYHRRP